MSSIMRWRNGLMALSVMAIAPVSHEVTNPVILRQDEPTCYPAIQHASRTLRRGAPTASGLVLAQIAVIARRRANGAHRPKASVRTGGQKGQHWAVSGMTAFEFDVGESGPRLHWIER